MELNLNSDYDADDVIDEEEYDDEYCADYDDEEIEDDDLEDDVENDAFTEDSSEYPYYSTPDNVCDDENMTQCDTKLVCETCDRDFQNMYTYQKHMSEHIVCSIDGCTFAAHEKIVALHVKTQHSTGLYYKICHLSTPEDVKKWREDRKKNFPSKENIAKRQEQQEEMFKRGEKLTTKRKFKKRDKLRLRAVKKKNTRRKPTKKPKTFSTNKSLIDEKRDWNGQMFPFRGTSDLYKTEEVTNDTFEDTEWEENLAQNTHHEIIINNSLGALMSAYNSDNSDNEEISTAKVIVKTNSESSKICDTIEKALSDNDAPTEEKICTKPLLVFKEAKSQEANESKSIYISNDKNFNRNKNKRKRTHNRKGKKLKTDHRLAKTDQQQPAKTEENVTNRKFVKTKVTLLERLLKNEIRHERNVLLQCVRHVVNNNFFKS